MWENAADNMNEELKRKALEITDWITKTMLLNTVKHTKLNDNEGENRTHQNIKRRMYMLD